MEIEPEKFRLPYKVHKIFRVGDKTILENIYGGLTGNEVINETYVADDDRADHFTERSDNNDSRRHRRYAAHDTERHRCNAVYYSLTAKNRDTRIINPCSTPASIATVSNGRTVSPWCLGSQGAPWPGMSRLQPHWRNLTSQLLLLLQELWSCSLQEGSQILWYPSLILISADRCWDTGTDQRICCWLPPRAGP